jgi:hypothetical protein
MLRIYGIDIDTIPEGKHVNELTEEEKIELVEQNKDNGEVYTLEGWFNYLNSDKIDTENMYWLPLNY